MRGKKTHNSGGELLPKYFTPMVRSYQGLGRKLKAEIFPGLGAVGSPNETYLSGSRRKSGSDRAKSRGRLSWIAERGFGAGKAVSLAPEARLAPNGEKSLQNDR